MSIPGTIVTKLGMGSEFMNDGRCIPLTYLQVLDDCSVIGTRTKTKNGYDALVVGAKPVKENKLTKPLKGMFAKANVTPRAVIKEFRVDSKQVEQFLVGTEFGVDHFVAGEHVDVTGTSSGKGFAGVMKRWNFGGLRATHGVSVSHRSHGSTGQNQDPGKVFKGKKMAGHLGNELVTIKNLEIIATDSVNRIIKVYGAVPGKPGSTLVIRKRNFKRTVCK